MNQPLRIELPLEYLPLTQSSIYKLQENDLWFFMDSWTDCPVQFFGKSPYNYPDAFFARKAIVPDGYFILTKGHKVQEGDLFLHEDYKEWKLVMNSGCYGRDVENWIKDSSFRLLFCRKKEVNFFEPENFKFLGD